MKKSVDFTEKRKHPRFEAEDNVFAVIKRKTMIICKVVNLSEGGVLFYSDDLVKIEDDLLDVDIYINDDVYIESVPATLVSDVTFPNETAFDGFPIRYLRLSFEDLSQIQKEKLINIIKQSAAYS